jgi:hypothetical protein
MSDFQFKIYESARIEERTTEKKKKNQKKQSRNWRCSVGEGKI